MDEIILDEGKYKFFVKDGLLCCDRYGEKWRDFIGDNAVHALFDECLEVKNQLTKEILTLRRMLWLNHGHKGMYGDDGEMQCGECLIEYGFYDWKRTSIDEIEAKIGEAKLKENEV